MSGEGRVLVVRRGAGANCSSIGSAVEMLFLSATAGAALVAAVTAMLRDETSDAPRDAPPDAPPTAPPDAASAAEPER